MNESEQFDKHLSAAKNELGVSFELKDRQREALQALYNSKDVICVLPTGYGKSIIFQLLPPFMTQKFGMDRLPVVLVVTPLNSIMQDQVLGLRRMGLMAFFLDIEGTRASTCPIGIHRDEQSDDDVEEADNNGVIFSNVPIESVKEGNYCYLYAHPETLIDKKEIGKMLRGRTMQKLVCAIAVDEVHMISEWGKEFRKSFSRLGQLTSIFPNIPHLALTATATSADLKVLSKTLDFRETHYIIANPDRPNIFMEIRRRLPNIKKYEKYDALLGEICQEFLETLQEFPLTVVYCDNLQLCVHASCSWGKSVL